MKVLVVGCGYVGMTAGAELARGGHEVFGLRRTPAGDAELRSVGIQPLRGDVTRREDLARLPGPFDWVVNTVSSTQGGVEEYRAVYVQGMVNLVDWLRGSPIQKFVYTSSTGVYGQDDGSWVDELSATEPASDTGRALVQAEQVLLRAAREWGFPAVILRVAGIYGPGRGFLFQQFVRGEARLVDDGRRISNMIHRDDVAGGIRAALERGRPGEIYSAVDDEPVTHREFYQWLAEQLGQPLPPASEAAESHERKRALTNKRVVNGKLKTELGYVFKYPNFRAGYGEEIRRLKAGWPAES